MEGDGSHVWAVRLLPFAAAACRTLTLKRQVTTLWAIPALNTVIPASHPGEGFYDDAGFCQDCDAPYCYHHWHVSETGYGYCPRSHRKSLDPHW